MLFYDVSKKESQELKDEYKLLAEKMFGIIKVGAIDCRDEEELCEEFMVFDTPRVKIFTENGNDDGEEFKGKKTWKAMSGAAANKMQSFVRTVNNDNYESFIDEQPDKNKILIFTDRKTTAPLYKSLSKTYKDKLVFGEVKKSSSQELFDKFGIKETPALLALSDPQNYQGEAYENMKEANIDQLKKFISNYAYAEKKEKKMELNHLQLKTSQSPNTGVCGRKTANLCLIMFFKGQGQGLIDQYKGLLEHFKNDPVTITYVFSKDEPYMLKQFNIDNQIGAVIYKPKRMKYTKMDISGSD